MTDSVINHVKERAKYTWFRNMINVLDSISIKLSKFRETTIFLNISPLEAIKSYTDMCDSLERDYRNMNAMALTSNPAYLPVSSVSYTLFNSGMSKRFAEIA